MNNDLISREALKKAIEQGEGFLWDNYGKDDLCVRKKYIDNAPTVDIPTELCKGCRFLKDCETCEEKLRPQGEWIEDSGNIACSHCHTIWLYRRTDFCPNCGADMRGGAE